MERDEFEAVVQEAVATLPEEFRNALANIAILIEDEPTEEHLDAVHVSHSVQLFGLYQGVPLTQRAGSLVQMPDRITLFRGPILRSYHTSDEVRQQIRSTVLHEIGHYLGLSEEKLREIQHDK